MGSTRPGTSPSALGEAQSIFVNYACAMYDQETLAKMLSQD